MTRPPGSASGPWRAPSHSPWSRPFARLAPQRHRSRCSPASPLPWAGPTFPGRSSSATASGLPDAVPAAASRNSLLGDLPVPVQDTSAHARVYDDAGPPAVSRSRRKACGFLLDGQHRRPEDVLRRSMAGLCAPLSTLHAPPLRRPAHNSGPAWIATHCRRGLPPPISCRSPGAPVHSINCGGGGLHIS